jgi:hypothetical protein
MLALSPTLVTENGLCGRLPMTQLRTVLYLRVIRNSKTLTIRKAQPVADRFSPTVLVSDGPTRVRLSLKTVSQPIARNLSGSGDSSGTSKRIG